MTTKQIAEAVNKDERTVQRWVKKLGDRMSSVNDKMSLSSPSNPANYDLEETCMIIEIGLGKNASDLYRMSAREQTKPSTSSSIDDAFKMAFVTLVDMAKNMNTRLTDIENKISERKVLLPAPQIDSRSNIMKHVNEYVFRTEGNHKDAYNLLYREYGYRTHCNPSLCAKNRNMKIIDFIESEGQIEILESIAIELFSK